MTTANQSQQVPPADERPGSAQRTPTESLVELTDVSPDHAGQPAPAQPVSVAERSPEERARQEQAAAAAASEATADLALLRQQVAAHPSAPPAVIVAPSTQAEPTRPTVTAPLNEAGQLATPPTIDRPDGRSTVPSRSPGDQTLANGTPDQRDATIDREVAARNWDPKTVKLDDMIELVRQTIYPSERTGTVASVSTTVTAHQPAKPSIDPATFDSGSAPTVEAQIAIRQHDGSTPTPPVATVSEQPSMPVETPSAIDGEPAQAAPAEAAE